MGSVIFATSIMVYAAPLVLPHTFSEGTVISADEVNANFEALKDEINILKVNVQAAPTGTIVAFAGDTVPDGWLLCDGTDINRATYSGLFTAIGIIWGAGDLASTFNLPDLRGRFLRGVDNGAGIDPDAAGRTLLHFGGNTGDAVGSYQLDEFGTHYHKYGSSARTGDDSGNGIGDADAGSTFNSASNGGNETRPKNAYVNYIIKY